MKQASVFKAPDFQCSVCGMQLDYEHFTAGGWGFGWFLLVVHRPPYPRDPFNPNEYPSAGLRFFWNPEEHREKVVVANP